jgi:hypothetical protein
MMTRSKRSVEKETFWRSVVEQQQRGDLNIRMFCQQKGISEPSFYAWRKELHKRDSEKVADIDSGGRLIPVAVVKPTCENATPSGQDGVNRPLEIGTPGGYTLRFDHDTTSETIVRVLEIIARCPTTGTTSC